MPLEQILKSSKLFNDIKTVAKEWQERIDEAKKAEQQVDESTIPNLDNRVKGANNDNNSQE